MFFLRDVREIRVQKEDDTDLRNSLLVFSVAEALFYVFHQGASAGRLSSIQFIEGGLDFIFREIFQRRSHRPAR